MFFPSGASISKVGHLKHIKFWMHLKHPHRHMDFVAVLASLKFELSFIGCWVKWLVVELWLSCAEVSRVLTSWGHWTRAKAECGVLSVLVLVFFFFFGYAPIYIPNSSSFQQNSSENWILVASVERKYLTTWATNGIDYGDINQVYLLTKSIFRDNFLTIQTVYKTINFTLG